MSKKLFLFNSSSKFGSNTYFKNIIHHLPDNDYYVINRNNINFMGHKKNLIISPSGFKKHFFNQLYLPLLVFKLKINSIYTNSMIAIFLCGKKNILSVRNVDPFLNKFKINLKYRFKLTMIKSLFIFSILFAKKIIFVSNFSYNIVSKNIKISKKKKVISYHGVDHVGNNISDKDLDFLFVGKFVHYHNLDFVFSLFNKLVKDFNVNYRIVLGDFDNDLKKKFTKKYDLLKNNNLLMNLSNNEVINLMKKSKILLFSSSYEACPFTLLEAMKCSCAVLASNAGPNREILIDNGVFYDINSFDDMYKKTVEMINNKSKVKELGNKNYYNSKKYTWVNTKKNIIDL
ncbi:glycosyltransferase family 4 protein [Alphaproteobacteria bacterium]|nr:glycosyltransferase family 4 protein [Alphaproteobacteria bacterium]